MPLDVHNANNANDVLTGDWEAPYQLGTVASSKAIISGQYQQHVVRPSPCNVGTNLTSKKRRMHFVLYGWRMLYELGGANLYYRAICQKERKKERNPLQRGSNEGHRCPRGTKSPVRCYWPNVVRLPWCPIKQVPLKKTRKLLNNPSFNPSKKHLAINFMKSGVDCMKQPKGYRRAQFTGTIRHVFQFDINE